MVCKESKGFHFFQLWYLTMNGINQRCPGDWKIGGKTARFEGCLL